MALSRADVEMWRDLGERGLIPPRPRVLEIGQANWFGDIEAPEDCRHESPFVTARRWYQKVLGFSKVESIDMHGEHSLRYDLNEPVPLTEVFDIVINTGTAEHVFDQRQVFETVHDRCAVGGLMVHGSPWQGWNDHGFYNYQPCFFKDLAGANDYEMLYAMAWRFGAGVDVMHYVAMRKSRDLPFRIPRQGKYQ